MSNISDEHDDLTAASTALSQGKWEEAIGILDGSSAVAESAAGLALRAHAIYGDGDLERAISAWEDLYSRHLELGNRQAASQAAAMVAMYLMMDSGLMAPVRGWLQRAERLIDDQDDSPVHAWVAMVRTYERVMCGDMETAGEHSQEAIRLGLKHDVLPAVVIGRTAAARLRIFAGDMDEGLAMLDELAVTLLSGEVDSLTTGMMLCELICAVQGLALYERASEWTQAMERWSQAEAFGAINGRCRVHRAEMLRLSGPCEQAEVEALRACEELRPWMRREFGWPLTELGNIRLRKGDLLGAKEAYLAAHAQAWSPQPGLALVLLAQGDLEAAGELIRQAVEHPLDIPSKERPPFGALRRAPLLDAQVEIAAASHDARVARHAADELASIAEEFPTEAMVATAALAQGRAALVEGNLSVAINRSEQSVGGWIEVGAPYEVGVARMVLGEAYHCAGRAEPARLEWEAAHTAFVSYGAELWAARAAERIAFAPALSSQVSETRVRESEPVVRNLFRSTANTRSISFDGISVTVADLKGLRFLERLLSQPGREFHVLDLIAVERGSLPTGSAVESHGAEASDSGPLLDPAARAAYQRRLHDVDEDIEEATRMNDYGRLELAQNDREYLINELRRAVGLGGRDRVAGSTVERARTSVTRSIRYALVRVGEYHPSLGLHLKSTIRTGTYCCYTPDPRLPALWTV